MQRLVIDVALLVLFEERSLGSLEALALSVEIARPLRLSSPLQLGPDLLKRFIWEAEPPQGVRDERVGLVSPDTPCVAVDEVAVRVKPRPALLGNGATTCRMRSRGSICPPRSRMAHPWTN